MTGLRCMLAPFGRIQTDDAAHIDYAATGLRKVRQGSLRYENGS